MDSPLPPQEPSMLEATTTIPLAVLRVVTFNTLPEEEEGSFPSPSEGGRARKKLKRKNEGGGSPTTSGAVDVADAAAGLVGNLTSGVTAVAATEVHEALQGSNSAGGGGGSVARVLKQQPIKSCLKKVSKYVDFAALDGGDATPGAAPGRVRTTTTMNVAGRLASSTSSDDLQRLEANTRYNRGSTDSELWDPVADAAAQTISAAAAFKASSVVCWGLNVGCACDLCYNSD